MSPREATLAQSSQRLHATATGAVGGAPVRSPLEGEHRAPLRVVRPKSRSRRLRPSAVLSMLAAAVVLAVALSVVAAQALLAQGQFRLAALQTAEAAAQTAHQRLELQVAELRAPQRIVWVAQHKLGMVVPTHVTYLQPVPLPPSPARS